MSDPYLDILGQRIRARRRDLRLSQEDLAHIAELDRSYVGRVERGQHNMTFITLIRLCRAMQCDVAALTMGLPAVRGGESPTFEVESAGE